MSQLLAHRQGRLRQGQLAADPANAAVPREPSMCWWSHLSGFAGDLLVWRSRGSSAPGEQAGAAPVLIPAVLEVTASSVAMASMRRDTLGESLRLTL